MNSFLNTVTDILDKSSDKDLAFYEQAHKEIQDDTMISGVWAKAFAQSDGKEDETKARYIKLRVTTLTEQTNKNKEMETDEERDIHVHAYESKNIDSLTEAYDKSVDSVAGIVGWYMVFGIILSALSTLVIVTGTFDEDSFFMLYMGLALLLPYGFLKYFLKEKPTFKELSKKIHCFFSLLLLASLSFPFLGWIIAPYIIYRWWNFYKAFNY